MLLKKEIRKLHLSLDELNYRPENDINFKDFYKSATNTMVRIMNVNRINDAFYYYRFILSKWHLFSKLVNGTHRHSNYFKTLKWQGNDILDLVSGDFYKNSFIVTNILNYNENEIDIINLKDTWGLKFGPRYLNLDIEDYNYILKPSIRNYYKFNIFNLKNEPILQITCNNQLDFYFTNNKTNYELKNEHETDSIIFIDTTQTEKDNEIAAIYSNIIDKNLNYGFSQVFLYDDKNEMEVELTFLVATAIFMILNRKMQKKKWKKDAMTIAFSDK